MIKFALRRNLIYVLQYIIWSLLRFLLTIYMDSTFKLGKSYIFIQSIFFGEILAGAIMYFSQKKYNKQKKDQYFMSIKLISLEDKQLVSKDNKIIILFFIFLITFLDLVAFSLLNNYLPRILNLSKSILKRLYGFTTIFCFFFYVNSLKLPVYRHHKFSVLVIGICLIVIIVSEFFFQKFDIFTTYGNLCIAFVYILIGQLFWSFMNIVEKYLFEYDFMNPFLVLLYQGVIGFLLSFFFLFDKIYFNDFVLIYKNNSVGRFVLFIFLLLAYIILSGGKNLFRVVTTKIYSPMVTTLADYILNPLYLIYYFGALSDFKKNGKLGIVYFVLNIIISLIISFFGCVYNEFIILFCCGLERDTHDQISKRADINIPDNQIDLIKIDDCNSSINNEIDSVSLIE